MELDRDRIEHLHRMVDRRLLGGVRSEGQLIGVLSHSVPHGELILNCGHAATMVLPKQALRVTALQQVWCIVGDECDRLQ